MNPRTLSGEKISERHALPLFCGVSYPDKFIRKTYLFFFDCTELASDRVDLFGLPAQD